MVSTKQSLLISTTGMDDTTNNDLLPHTLLQLHYTKIPVFQQTVLKWHRNYMEGKLQITQLVQMANDEESQILCHMYQWVETIDHSITAL